MTGSLLNRKRDLLYLTYFTIAIPIAFIVDFQPLYPHHLIPDFMLSITDFYIDTYHDQFFINEPVHFLAFIWSEALIQVPMMICGWGALYHNSPKLPLLLLPFSCLIFITTGTLMAEFWFWAVPLQHKLNLTSLYGPYLALSGFMMGDMLYRLNKVINSATSDSENKKKL